MVKVLGTGTTTDGKEYVIVDKSDFQELHTAKLLVDFAKEHGRGKKVLDKLTGQTKELPEGVTEEDENSFYKLRSDWLNVKL